MGQFGAINIICYTYVVNKSVAESIIYVLLHKYVDVLEEYVK